MTMPPKAASIAQLPIPSPDAQAHSLQLVDHIADQIAAHQGWIDFARYMQLALYAPGLGYYSAGAKKFGAAGDFVTAPEISSLFARSLARQAAQVVEETQGDILELGAGSGILAAELFLELQQLDSLPGRYLILEVSAQLQAVQLETLQSKLPPELFARISWLDALPVSFSGLVLANEVLDALPVHLVQQQADGLVEMGVAVSEQGFVWQERALTSGQVYDDASNLDLPTGYLTELCPAASALVTSLAEMLQQGVLLLIDYGFPRREYYHALRSEGSLMCHYRHHAHGNPFLYPGLQDITAHVDFTRIAEAGVAHGVELLGYCNQAQFLINCGITELLASVSPHDLSAYLPLAAQAQTLLSPAEMGELFKVIALGKCYEAPLLGFARGDKSHAL